MKNKLLILGVWLFLVVGCGGELVPTAVPTTATPQPVAQATEAEPTGVASPLPLPTETPAPEPTAVPICVPLADLQTNPC